MSERVRLPLNIKVPPYLMDHRFRGRAVLPAVETVEVLAASTLAHVPEANIRCICDARFDKFLVVEKGVKEIDAFNDLEILGHGTAISRLITRTRSRKAGITRTKEHAVLRFEDCPKNRDQQPLKISPTPGYHVPAETIYKDLVPFGPHFHNLKEGVTLWETASEARVCAPNLDCSAKHLGSPFPLDAAFHAACVWGQRYAGIVGFPVGFGRRLVHLPTERGMAYTAQIIPGMVHLDRFSADIWIMDSQGILREFISGVVMKDVSGGRTRPPSWIMA